MKPERLKPAIASLIVTFCLMTVARADGFIFSGRIESTGVGLVVVKDDLGTNYRIQVERGAQVTLNGHPVRLDHLKRGDAATLVIENREFAAGRRQHRSDVTIWRLSTIPV